MGILFALLFSPCENWLKLPKRKLHKLGQIIGQTVEEIAYCNRIMGQSVIVPSAQVYMWGFLGRGQGGLVIHCSEGNECEMFKCMKWWGTGLGGANC